MTTEVKHSSAWRTLTGVEVKHSGAWRDVQTIEVKHGGVWRTVFSALSAIFNTNGDSNIRLGAACYAGLQISNTGTEYEYTSGGGLGSIGTWLNSGSTSEVWVECVLVSGTWNSLNAGTGTRLATTTTRSWRIVQSSGGIRTVTCNFKFWDAASGGNLLDQTGNVSFVAEYTV
jgi:hypothetical protein